MRTKGNWIFIFLVDILLIIASILFLNEKSTIVLVFIVWINLLIYSMQDISNRSSLFAYLISFFVFLIGRELLERFNIHTILLPFSEELNIFAEELLLISLIFLGTGYLLFSKMKFTIWKVKKKKNIENDYFNYCVRKVSRWIFLGTYLFNLIVLIDVVLFVLQHGYLAYYTSYSSRLPYIIVKIGEMSSVAFWIFMATMPKHSECKKEIGLYIIYLCITLGTGRRYPFVAGLLVLFVYFIMRNKVQNKGEVWISKKAMILCLISLPVLIAILTFVNQIRFANELNFQSFKDSITDFVYQQGVSINFIKRTEKYKFMLPEDRIYTFGTIISFLKGNFLSRLLGVVTYGGNTVEHALYGNSLAHALSYIVLGKSYLNGEGLGCCYIAECFHDWGYLGVVIVNFIYGTMFARLFTFNQKGVWKISAGFLMLNSLLLAPRGNTDGFIGILLEVSTWGTFLLTYLGAKTMYKRSKKTMRQI